MATDSEIGPVDEAGFCVCGAAMVRRSGGGWVHDAEVDEPCSFGHEATLAEVAE